MCIRRIFPVALLFVLGVAGCARSADCSPVTPDAATSIPACILARSDKVVVMRLGEAYFRDRCYLDPAFSGYHDAEPMCVEDSANCSEYLQRPYYLMRYSCTVSGESGERISAEFVMDAAGRLVSGEPVSGLPDCAHHPERCVFISESEALQSAAEVGLEHGASEWETSFHWYAGEVNAYVWTVSNTLEKDESTGEARGETVVIDAASGEVVATLGWLQTP